MGAPNLHVKMVDAYRKPGHVITQMIVETTVMKVQLMAPRVVSTFVLVIRQCR